MYHALIITISVTGYILLLFLFYGWLWIIGNYENFDDLVKTHWYLAPIILIMATGNAWVWIRSAESWWNTLIKHYGKPFNIPPEELILDYRGYLDIDEHSHNIKIICSRWGLILERHGKSKIYIPWTSIKNIVVRPFIKNTQKAEIKLHYPEPAGYEFNLTWHADLTRWVPDSVQISSAR